jgi:hypothetical protein
VIIYIYAPAKPMLVLIISMTVSHLFPSGSFSKGLLLQICGCTSIYKVFEILKQLWLGTVTNEKLPYIYMYETNWV